MRFRQIKGSATNNWPPRKDHIAMLAPPINDGSIGIFDTIVNIKT
jgi:hypothetical protein